MQNLKTKSTIYYRPYMYIKLLQSTKKNLQKEKCHIKKPYNSKTKSKLFKNKQKHKKEIS